MGNNVSRVGMQQDGWGAQGPGPVGSATSPATAAPAGQHPIPQGALHARMVANSGTGMPMRPNSQPGPRQMLQSQMMTNGKCAQSRYFSVSSKLAFILFILPLQPLFSDLFTYSDLFGEEEKKVWMTFSAVLNVLSSSVSSSAQSNMDMGMAGHQFPQQQAPPNQTAPWPDSVMPIEPVPFGNQNR